MTRERARSIVRRTMNEFGDVKVLFVAGFGPIVREGGAKRAAAHASAGPIGLVCSAVEGVGEPAGRRATRFYRVTFKTRRSFESQGSSQIV
jgi:hypothetical protein